VRAQVDAKTTMAVLELSFIYSSLKIKPPRACVHSVCRDLDACVSCGGVCCVFISCACVIASSRLGVICEIVENASRVLLDDSVGCEFVLSTEVISRLIAQAAGEVEVEESIGDVCCVMLRRANDRRSFC
jgi:hypothetical protein